MVGVVAALALASGNLLMVGYHGWIWGDNTKQTNGVDTRILQIVMV